MNEYELIETIYADPTYLLDYDQWEPEEQELLDDLDVIEQISDLHHLDYVAFRLPEDVLDELDNYSDGYVPTSHMKRFIKAFIAYWNEGDDSPSQEKRFQKFQFSDRMELVKFLNEIYMTLYVGAHQ